MIDFLKDESGLNVGNTDAYHLLDVNEFGWKVVEGCLEIDWDDPSNFEQVKESVCLSLRGCGCKKGCTMFML